MIPQSNTEVLPQAKIWRYLNERNDFQETKAWYKTADIFLNKKRSVRSSVSAATKSKQLHYATRCFAG
jgi:hypothetical protein